MNSLTWAPYFQVRSLLAQAVRSPERARELIARAAAAADPEAGFRAAPRVRRLAILVQAFNALLSAPPDIDLEAIRAQFRMVERISGKDDGSQDSTEALTLVAQAFDGFRENPAREIAEGHLAQARAALDRLPFVDVGVAGAISKAAADTALELIHGGVTTWVHRVLERIDDERHLHRILLRLSQAALPLHAQVLHGPVEYGKDVVVLTDSPDGPLLMSYQVKVGDLTKADWYTIAPQLEEIFTVPLPEFVTGQSVRREGILFFNGHFGPYALPSVEGWLKEQKRAYGRDYRKTSPEPVVTS